MIFFQQLKYSALNMENWEPSSSRVITVSSKSMNRGISFPRTARSSDRTMKAIELRDKKYVIGVIDDRTELIAAVRSRELSIGLLYRLINEMKIETKETIYHLARLVEIHDHSTGSHLERMEHYTRLLAEEYCKIFQKRDPRLTEK